ncbi:hypothetical protein HD806DRAFT_509964 [Xylariaceae sp. AK1471]|nr:hypothetical protein HD806DRAFT_509964 [Xylariaceae sp. AK1471]
MADPLLTSLCTICHIQAPRYKCPRCGARTCSLSCVKKHKTWSSCNGERDATAFVQLDKLKTDAGIDHDYNFLTKIERSVERAERILREDRDILPDEASRPPPHKKSRLHKGQSRGRTAVDDGSRKFDRNVMNRMRELGIHVSSVPYGMTRSKENKMSWNRRTKTINWQVEWVLFNTELSTAVGGQPQSTRILHKALDETPLHVAFTEALEHYRLRQLSDRERAEEKRALRKQQAIGQGSQDPTTNTWQASPCLMQNHTDGSWSVPIETNGHHTARHKYRFFFLRQRKPIKGPKTLIPLKASENLASILPGQEIVEFPTIYALPVGASLDEGYIIEEIPRKESSKKRMASPLVDYGLSGKISAELANEEEDGEVMDLNTSDDSTSSSGSDSEMSD